MKRLLLAVIAMLPYTFVSAIAAEPALERPAYRREQVILSAEQFAKEGEMPYLAFPAVVRVNDHEVLISYKRGRSHALDPGAVIETIRFDTLSNQIVSRSILASKEELIGQMGEWVEFPGGRISNLIDVQRVAVDRNVKRHHRTGIELTSSDDRGLTFSPLRRLEPVDGIEYGYVFEAIISQGRVYMLAMSFPELTVGQSSFDGDGKRLYGEVSVLSSDDEGSSWKHVRNLTREFGGLSLNESSLIADGDGFIIATRSYDNQARLHRVDKDFRLLKERNLGADYSFIDGPVGRPRLFRKDGKLYLLGRNHRGGPMELALFRIDPRSFDVERAVILDPVDMAAIKDGYYAVPYFQKSEAEMLNVITYRRPGQRDNPDIVRLEFRWDEVR